MFAERLVRGRCAAAATSAFMIGVTAAAAAYHLLQQSSADSRACGRCRVLGVQTGSSFGMQMSARVSAHQQNILLVVVLARCRVSMLYRSMQ